MHIGLANDFAAGAQGLANLQLFKVAAKRVRASFNDFGAAHMLVRDGREHAWRALHSSALHKMPDCPDAAQFLTPTGAARAAMFERGQGRAVAC